MVDFDAVLNAAIETNFCDKLAKYTPPDGGDFICTVPVNFDEAPKMIEGTNGSFSTEAPTIGLRISSLPDGVEIEAGGSFEINGTSYLIDDVPIDEGWADCPVREI